MRRIAIINQKGGVGKTTTTVNLGCGLARAGQSVVLVDLDPQAHLTMHLGYEPNNDEPNVYQLLTGTTTFQETLKTHGEHLKVIPANIDLAAAEVELSSVVGREVILRDAMEDYPGRYDYLLMDCPPSLSILTINALCTAQEIFITLQPHFLALQGMGKLLETIQLVARRINRNLKVSGVILCMYETGTKLANEVVADMERFFVEARTKPSPWSQTRIFKTRIRRNIKLAEAPSFGQDIYTYAPISNGAEDYAALTAEVLEMTHSDGSVVSDCCDSHPVVGEPSHDQIHPPPQAIPAADHGDSLHDRPVHPDPPAPDWTDPPHSGQG